MAEQYSGFRSQIDALLADVGKFLGDLVEAPRGEHTDSHIKLDEHLQQFWKAYYSLKSRHDDAALSVAVLALTKSGKSTLLNALLGAECLPVNNVPETARICKIIHTPSSIPEQSVMQEGDLTHHGEAAIRRRLQEINHEVRAREHQHSDEKILLIKAPFSALQSVPSSDDSTNLYLLDTPGPNEAGEEGLRYQVERLLDSVDAVIYLLDYTKLKTAEEAQVLDRLKTTNPLLVRRLSQRLFFVVNKVDQLQQSEGLDEDETREYVADLITRQLSCEGFHLTPEQVMLLSARDALLSRLILTGKASESAQRMFLRNAFGRRWEGRSVEEVGTAAMDMLEGSGLPELESRVLSFLYSHGGGVKLLATVDDIARLLKEVENVAVTSVAALKGSVEGLAAKADGLRADLQEALNQLDDVLDRTASLHCKITHEIREHLEGLRSRLFTHIMEALNTEGITSPAPASSSSPSTSTRSSIPRHWTRVRQRFASLFSGTSLRQGLPRTPDRERLLGSLAELHDDVMGQINTEVRDFWGGLEQVCNARNTSLITTINKHLEELTARIEAAVEQRLEVRLQPAQLRLPLPDAHQFHSDLQDLITRGVEERQERHVRVGQRQFQNRELRGHGICRWGSYWVPAPMTRTIVETYTSTVYQLQPGEVMRHFIELVDGAVESSEGVLAAYVEHYFQQQVAQARTKIQEYGDRYVGVVTAALEASYEGSQSREGALAQVEGHLKQVRLLADNVTAVQSHLEDVVPSAGVCSGYEQVDAYDLDYEEHLNPILQAPPAPQTPADLIQLNPLVNPSTAEEPLSTPLSHLGTEVPTPLVEELLTTSSSATVDPSTGSYPQAPAASPSPSPIPSPQIDLIDLTSEDDSLPLAPPSLPASLPPSLPPTSRSASLLSLPGSTTDSEANFPTAACSVTDAVSSPETPAPAAASPVDSMETDTTPSPFASGSGAVAEAEAEFAVSDAAAAAASYATGAGSGAGAGNSSTGAISNASVATISNAPSVCSSLEADSTATTATSVGAFAGSESGYMSTGSTMGYGFESGYMSTGSAFGSVAGSVTGSDHSFFMLPTGMRSPLPTQPLQQHPPAVGLDEQGGNGGAPVGGGVQHASQQELRQLEEDKRKEEEREREREEQEREAGAGVEEALAEVVAEQRAAVTPDPPVLQAVDAGVPQDAVPMAPQVTPHPSVMPLLPPLTTDAPPCTSPSSICSSDAMDASGIIEHIHVPPMKTPPTSEPTSPFASSPHPISPPVSILYTDVITSPAPHPSTPLPPLTPSLATPAPANPSASPPSATPSYPVPTPFAGPTLQMQPLSSALSPFPAPSFHSAAVGLNNIAMAAAAMAAAVPGPPPAARPPPGSPVVPVSTHASEADRSLEDAGQAAERTGSRGGCEANREEGGRREGDGEGDVDVSDYTKICVVAEDIPDAPFDYQKGFAQAMSSGALGVGGAVGGGVLSDEDNGEDDDSDEWTLVEGGQQEEGQGNKQGRAGQV